MRSQLIVVESRIKVLQADAATRQPQATPSPDRHSPKTLAAMAPDLAMKALAALAGLHQGWAGEDAWHTAEDRYMVQRMKGLDREDLERSERSNLLKVRCTRGRVTGIPT